MHTSVIFVNKNKNGEKQKIRYSLTKTETQIKNTGCSRKNCTKFKHHYLATICHRVMPFSAKCSKRKCLHDKGQCLNTAIKYSLLFSWQVNYYENKAVDLVTHHVLLSHWHGIWSFWLLEGVSTVKIFSSKNQVRLTYVALVIGLRFFKCLHTFNRFSCLLLSGTELHGVETLWAANHSWQFSRLKNVKFQPLSRDLLWTLTCPWLSFLAAN